MTDDICAGIERAAGLLREARHAIALTGAGSSTPSGIPDFRSPGSGLWERANPYEVASIHSFERHPETFFDWIRPMVGVLLAAEPNAGHLALAQLERGGFLKAIITQNIDALHQRAGSQTVLEAHGHFRESTCTACRRVVPTQDLLPVVVEAQEVPRCARCGGVMKPNVVLFGEHLPEDVMVQADGHVRQADVMLVAGSSLEVMPAAYLPKQVQEQGGRVIVVNLSPTYIDDVADVVLTGDMAELLPRLARACEEGVVP